LLSFFVVMLWILGGYAQASSQYSRKCSAYDATNTQGATMNTVDCLLLVSPGDVVLVSTCNQTSLTGDTYLRLFDPTNTVQLAFHDDGCNETSSSGGTQFKFQVPLAYQTPEVSLHLHQGCFSTSTCSAVTEYSLVIDDVVVGNPSPSPVQNQPVTSDQNCPVEDCVDIHQAEKDWVTCDMCICDRFNTIFFAGHLHQSDCGADEKYYDCFVKYDIKSASCKSEMKPSWIAIFFFIGFCGFVFVGSVLAFVIYLMCCKAPNKPIYPILHAEKITDH